MTIRNALKISDIITVPLNSEKKRETLMFKTSRYVLMLASVAIVASCGTRSSSDGVEPVLDNSVFSEEALSADGNAGGGAAPGTQADLVINIGDRVFFETDSTDLTAEARSVLEQQASWLGQYSNLNVTVEGHSDERGTREYNLALGDRRANAVKSYLVALGVAPSRVTTISFGKERPAVPGANNMAWSQNRRGITKVQ